MGLDKASQIIEARRFLEGKFTQRDAIYRQLRKLYSADYWSGSQVTGIKLVYNLIASVVDRYTDFMSLPPDWQVLPHDVTREATLEADKQEKILYSQWELNNILVLQQWQGHLQSLLGFFGFMVLPNPGNKEKYVRIEPLIPEFVLPMPKSDNIHDLDFVIVKGYDYTKRRELFEPQLRHDQKKDTINSIQYFDKDKIITLENGEEVSRITHNFGFIPVVLGQNRVKPHAIEGVSDIEQSVGLNQYLNELISWQADIIEYAANPITIIKGLIGDKTLPTGPGAQWDLPRDSDASFLTWPGSPPTVETMINRVVQAIQDMTNINEPLFGRDVPSGTSGAAVKSFLSGIQAAMLRKQVTMGDAYVRVNEIIFKIMERMFSDKDIVARGTKKGTMFVIKIKGKEINGNYRNKAIWPAGVLDLGSRINQEITKLNNKLQSRFTSMENIGILSPLDEMKRIKEDDEEELQRQIRLANPSGLPAGQSGELASAQDQLARFAGPEEQGGGGNDVQELAQVVRDIPKIKGAVFFGGQEGDKFTLVLTTMSDKSTIVNKLPEKFKGKITFRKHNPSADTDLQAIVDNEESADAVA